jgi:hypothetical protein
MRAEMRRPSCDSKDASSPADRTSASTPSTRSRVFLAGFAVSASTYSCVGSVAVQNERAKRPLPSS